MFFGRKKSQEGKKHIKTTGPGEEVEQKKKILRHLGFDLQGSGCISIGKQRGTKKSQLENMNRGKQGRQRSERAITR